MFGSGHSFTEKYIEMEENLKLLDFFLSILSTSDHLASVNAADIDDSELAEYVTVPDTVDSAHKLRVCLQESDDYILPGSANHVGEIQAQKLIDESLHSLNSNLLPEVKRAYEELRIKTVKIISN